MVTGGACLTAMCHLLGFPTDPGKDDDKAWDITVLGARIQLDLTALSVSAAVDANKVQKVENRFELYVEREEVPHRQGSKVRWSLGIYLYDCGRPTRKSFR